MGRNRGTRDGATKQHEQDDEEEQEEESKEQEERRKSRKQEQEEQEQQNEHEENEEDETQATTGDNNHERQKAFAEPWEERKLGAVVGHSNSLPADDQRYENWQYDYNTYHSIVLFVFCFFFSFYCFIFFDDANDCPP